MLKQSYRYVVLQIINIVVNIFVLLYLAKNVDPETFSIFAIYTVILTFMATFSFLGCETVLLRNILHWREVGCNKKIPILISYTLFSRFVMSLVIVIPMVFYSFYLTNYKYEGQYFSVFMLFILAGMFNSLVNSNALILKSFNRYLSSLVVLMVSGVVGKLLALYYFIEYGFLEFVIVLVIIPIVAFVASCLLIKDYLSIRHLKLRYFFRFRKYKYFIFGGYLNYFKMSIDQLLVSIFLSNEVLAVYSLARRLEDIGRSLIEGFFDPIMQKTVRYKSNFQKMNSYINRIFRVKNIMLVVVLAIVIMITWYAPILVSFIGLEHYEGLPTFLILASWSCALYLLYKLPSGLTYMFVEQKKLFSIDLVIAAMSILLLMVFIFGVNIEYVYINRVALGAFLLFVFFVSYNKLVLNKIIKSETFGV